MSECRHPLSLVRTWRACAIVFALLVGLTGCAEETAQPAEPPHPAGGEQATLRRGLGGEPGTLDPHRAIDSFAHAILRDLFEGLITEDRDGRIVPGAAQDWEVSGDALTYRFRLRPDLAWSNGDPLTAADFVAGLRRVLDPATASPRADLFSSIPNADAVSAEDDRTVVIRLSRATPHLLKLLATAAAAPLHRPSFAEHGDGHARPGKLISNGAYRLDAWNAGSQIRLARNRHYRDAGSVYFERVHYVPLPEAGVELTMYRAGQIDMTSTVPTQHADWVRENLPRELQVGPHLAVYYYAFDLTEAPFRDNRLLREALVLALDRDLLARAVAGFAPAPAYGFVPPGTDDYPQQSWSWRPWSDGERVARARERYAAAGFGPDNPLKVTILYNANDAIRRMTLAVAAMWKEVLGVQSTLVDEEFRVFLTSRRERARWDILRMGWTADYDDAANFLALMRSDSPGNDSGYANAEFDNLTSAAELERDPGRRRDLLQRAERVLLADYAVVPVYFYVSRRLVKPYLDGPAPTPMNQTYSRMWRRRVAPDAAHN